MIDCEHCNKTFDINWKLEKYLKTHSTSTSFKCNECNKTFYLKWRLKHHIKGQEEYFVKFCSYFNNHKECPYQDVGCMFRHEDSPHCRYQEKCTSKLCQFKHSLKNDNKFKCNTCNKTFQSSAEIENHNKSKHSSDQKENINNEGDESEPEAENEEAVPTCLQFGQIYDVI